MAVSTRWSKESSRSVCSFCCCSFTTTAYSAFTSSSTHCPNECAPPFNVTPTKQYSYAVQTTYSEPLWRAAFLQLSYQFKYAYSKSDRATYDFSNLGDDFFC